MGRSTKLTPEVQERICGAIKSGMHLHRSALLGGISEGTFRRWMDKGDPEAIGEPDLTAMPMKTLRAVAKTSGITIGPRSSRNTIIATLTEAGEGSWEPYRAFRVAVERAELEMEQTLVAQWRLLAPDNPGALKEFMARRFRHWSPTQHVELSGPDGGPIDVSVEAQLAEALEAYKQGVTDGRARESEVAGEGVVP